MQGEDDEERELPLPDTAPSPEEHLENSELGRELAAALDEVSDEHRRIVLLRDVSGMSYTEIAEILEVSEGHGKVAAVTRTHCFTQNFTQTREPFSFAFV